MTFLINNLKQAYRLLRFRINMSRNLPSAIGFEMTTRCNALCPMCVRRDYQIVNEDMDFHILEKTIDEVTKWHHKNILFNLTGLSEPTLYPRLVESVVYVKSHLPESRVRIITNGIALTSGLSKDLIQVGLDEFIISLNGTSRDDYLALCGVDTYETVTENIKALLTNRRLLSSNSLAINLNFKRHEANSSSIQTAISYWERLLGPQDCISVSDILPFRGRQTISMYNNISRYPCAHLWGEVKLDVKGNIYPCDGKVMDFNYREKSELLLGNIHTVSIENAYLSEKVKNFRRIHLSGQLDDLPTCKVCPGWYTLPNYWIRNNLFKFSRKLWI